MATTSAVDVAAGDEWTLAYTAAGTVTLNVQNRHPGTNLLIRVGASAAADDAPGSPAESVSSGDGRSIILAAGDKVYLRSRGAAAADATLVISQGGEQIGSDEYETVAASQTAQVLGTTGAVGDYLARVIIIPANLLPGAVTLLDNATSITLFPGGLNSLVSLAPVSIEIGARSVSGAWKISTGANVSVIAIGTFA